MKKIIIILIVIAAVMGGILVLAKSKKSSPSVANSALQCSVKEITFYYLTQCEWCNKIKEEGTIDHIESLGVKVNKINASIGPIKHKFTGVPAFVINGKVYEGYKTFEVLEKLLGCPLQNDNEIVTSQSKDSDYIAPKVSAADPPQENNNIISLNEETGGNQDQVLGEKDQIASPSSNLQVIKMDASSRGYSPSYFKVKAGIPVRWEITDTGTSGCTNAIIADGLLKGQINLSRGKVAVQEFTPTTPGKYQFSCWMGMISGIIEVE